MFHIKDLFNDYNKLSEYYSSFDVKSRILLTGHSHQAWPDCSFEGIKKSWDDAAKYVDDKWSLAFEKADIVRENFARLISVEKDEIALAQNTHDLLVKLLSSLDFINRPKIITTDSEFHTVRRQLDLLYEAKYIDLVRVDCNENQDLSEQISILIDDKTSLVIVSKVFFNNAFILNNISLIQEKCNKFGAYLLVDSYHAVNVVPFDVIEEKLEEAFIIGGGYKYCQLGEGNCFMRVPKENKLKPLISGWFSEFATISSKKSGEILYGPNHWAFAGSTYDVISHYRAVEVFNFFQIHNLDINFLTEINRKQINLLADEFDKYNFNENIISRFRKNNLENYGGFFVLKSEYCSQFENLLKKENVFVDYRGNSLRLGPAPYLNNLQLKEGIKILYEASNKIIL